MEANTAVGDIDGVNGYYYRKSCNSKHEEDDNKHLEEAQEHVTCKGNISLDEKSRVTKKKLTRPIRCSGSRKVYRNRFS